MPLLRIALGLVVGSLAALWLRRLAHRLPGASTPDATDGCPRCGAAPSLAGRIPLLAATPLGRCRQCGARGARSLWLDLSAVLGTAVVFWRAGGTPALYVALVVLWLAIAASAIDLRLRIIPNRLLAGAAILGLLAMLPLGEPAYVQGILGAAALLAIGAVLAVVGRGGFGLGDVKYLAVVGLLLGLRPGVLSLLLAVMLGGLYAAGLLATRRATRKDTIAFGPFIAIGSVIVALLLYTPPR